MEAGAPGAAAPVAAQEEEERTGADVAGEQAGGSDGLPGGSSADTAAHPAVGSPARTATDSAAATTGGAAGAAADSTVDAATDSAASEGARPKKNFRRRRTAPVEDEEDVGDSALQDRLKATREMQRYRTRFKGIDVAVMPSEEPKGDQLADDDDAARTTQLNATFTVQSTATEIDKNMEQYIEERLAETRPDLYQRRIDARGVVQPRERTLEEALYDVPEHLRQEEKEEEPTEAPVSQSLTSIVEVDLPIEYKFKNIEETEEAKKRLKYQRQERYHLNTAGNSALPANMTVNFTNTNQNQNLNYRYGQAYNFDDKKQASKRTGQASDDLALDRFKKRFRFGR